MAQLQSTATNLQHDQWHLIPCDNLSAFPHTVKKVKG